LQIEQLIKAIVSVAEDWQDPDHPPRADATERTLGAPNRFTEEALAFAVNQQMSLLTEEALYEWVAKRPAGRPCVVGVLHTGNVPLEDFRVLLAVVLTGHQYLGAVAPASPYLMPAFVEALRQRLPELPAAFARAEALFARAEALVSYATDEVQAHYAEQADDVDMPPTRRAWPRSRYSVAVLDGHESEVERDGLAEDALLHEGRGYRALRLLWAPADLTPDAYLESFATFRGVFPAHAETPGGLKMQQAFLTAHGTPHAYGDGLEFLLSKGAPDVQAPGHLRWVPYEALEDVAIWLGKEARSIEQVVARPGVATRLPDVRPVIEPGELQRPHLQGEPDDMDIVAFLHTL
jgi:hypothetical protein